MAAARRRAPDRGPAGLPGHHRPAPGGHAGPGAGRRGTARAGRRGAGRRPGAPGGRNRPDARSARPLPERWAQALWLSEVEGLPPGEVGARLGVGRGAAAVLLHRAREGLRLAYLRAYPGAPRDPGCAAHWAALAAQARGRAGRRVQHHLAGCADCRGRLDLLRRVNLRLAGLVGSAAALLAALVLAPVRRPAADRGAGGLRGALPGHQ
ncbi:RNA polymerase sigma factor [Kitasatospora saccharophila]|uniref:RNA polymerase sigma factor n=1 Tax=Kitasatospora saccharophila TaxID=407973 RepID=UPI0036416B6E